MRIKLGALKVGMFVVANGSVAALAAMLAAPIFAADEQTLYRCVQDGKATTYQNEPCPVSGTAGPAVAYVRDRNLPAYRAAPAPGALDSQ